MGTSERSEVISYVRGRVCLPSPMPPLLCHAALRHVRVAIHPRKGLALETELARCTLTFAALLLPPRLAVFAAPSATCDAAFSTPVPTGQMRGAAPSKLDVLAVKFARASHSAQTSCGSSLTTFKSATHISTAERRPVILLESPIAVW